jgi:hypothetical protein
MCVGADLLAHEIRIDIAKVERITDLGIEGRDKLPRDLQTDRWGTDLLLLKLVPVDIREE